MISIRGTANTAGINNKIIFSPRAGFKKKGSIPTLEFSLIYGHRCPYCSNVMQALFKSPKTFSLWAYEETTLLSQGEKNSGEVRSTYPNEKTKQGKSCYRMDFNPADGGSVKITLKNHIMRHAAIAEREFNGNGLWEVGEKPCTMTGIFSLREDLLVKDWLLFSQIQETEITYYNIPKIKDIILDSDPNFRLVQPVGVAPPVIIIDKHSLVYGFHYGARSKMSAYIKKKA